jgi:DNA invertase Pin-like site-specific DNA recombinase
MKVIYARVSTQNQNEERQLEKGVKSFIDKCSGAVPFIERPQAKKLIEFLKDNPGTITEVIAVDRLGRSTLDILNTIELFKSNNWQLKIDNLGMDNSSPFFELMISLLGTLAQHEKNIINERAQQGREIAKAKGNVYKGRKPGTKDNRDKILSKHQDIVKCLSSNMKITDISNVTNKTRATIYKVKKML